MIVQIENNLILTEISLSARGYRYESE